MLSGNIPFPSLNDAGVILAVMTRDERPLAQPLKSPAGDAYADLWEVAKRCWVKDPSSRPSMQQVTRDLTLDLDGLLSMPLDRIPAEFKIQGDTWHAIPNPAARRTPVVRLEHTWPHFTR